MYAPVLLHKSACASLGKAQIFPKSKNFSRYPSPNLPLKVWGGLFACTSFSISSFRIAVYLHNNTFPDLVKEENLLNTEKFLAIKPSISPLEEWGGIFLSHMICHSARSANARTHRHYKQKPASRFKQPADFPEKRKKHFTTPWNLPLRIEGFFQTTQISSTASPLCAKTSALI